MAIALLFPFSANATQTVTVVDVDRLPDGYSNAYSDGTNVFSVGEAFLQPGDLVMRDDAYVNSILRITDVTNPVVGDHFGVNAIRPDGTSDYNFITYKAHAEGNTWCSPPVSVVCIPTSQLWMWALGMRIGGTGATDGLWTLQIINNGGVQSSRNFTVVPYNMAAYAGKDQHIRVLKTTPDALAVKVTYPNGTPAKSKQVTFAITSYPHGTKTGGVSWSSSGGDAASYTASTDAGGVARAYLTSGYKAGTYVVTASSTVAKQTVPFTITVTTTDLADSIDKEKSAGPDTTGCDGLPQGTVGLSTKNPINTATGNKYRVETDYVGTGPFPLNFTRYYNYLSSRAGSLGAHWRSFYDRSIAISTVTNKNKVTTLADVIRGDGKVLRFTLSNGVWVPAPDVTDKLESVAGSGYKYTCSADHVELYSSAGKLQSVAAREGFAQTLSYDAQGLLSTVQDAFGRTLSFGYDASSRLVQMLDPAGQPFVYGYDAVGNLASVKFPGQNPRQYLYENTSLPAALTGIVDENGARYATFSYDSQGRATISQLANGADYAKVSYYSDGTRVVTDGLGTQRKYGFSVLQGVARRTSLSDGLCDSCGSTSQLTGYNTSGFVTSVTDNKGGQTTYVRNPRGLETSRTEAVGTALARTITTTWHATYRLPLSIAEPGRTTAFSYDSAGRLLSRTETDTATNATRTTTYTYNAQGLLATVNGPRIDVNDVTSFTYDAQGNVATVTDPLGKITQYTAYDAHGRPLSTTDPSGLVATYSYDLMGRLASRTAGGLVTAYSYDGVGQLKRMTRPDGSWLEYQYDDAHRPIKLSDNLGNATSFTLNANGKVTKRQVLDATATVATQRGWAYDQLGRVTQEIDSASRIQVQYQYDANGNRSQVIDALGSAHTYAYDALNRLNRHTDPLSGVAAYAYDARDNLTQVTDPRNVVTGYTYSGLNDRTREASPDGGSSDYTFDAAGNVKTRSWANGKSVSYRYDALNRITLADYGGGAIVSYEYDSTLNGNYGVGRLTQLSDPSGTTAWTYDQLGRVTQKIQAVGDRMLTTGYAYDSFGRLVSQTYPSGRQIAYGYSNGQLTSLTLDGQALIGNIVWRPFGPAKSWTRNNGTSMTRTYDQDGQLKTHSFGTGTRSLAYDLKGRITSITEPGRSRTVGYDNLDRLVSETLPTGGMGTYGYDANGNRTSKSDGSGSSAYSYSTASNRLQSISGAETRAFSYDGAGNVVADGQHSYSYDNTNRLSGVDGGQTQYLYNGLGQRVRKAGSITAYAAWNDQGQVIGEYDAAAALAETVYLGTTPVAVIQNGIAYAIDADQIDSPRVIRGPTGQVVWRWDTDAFGSVAANGNPSGAGTFTYNLRFPGQFYDGETGKHNNGFRDYDPGGGRYLQSDPIGLRGGINTYSYVGGNPLSSIDPEGLAACKYSISSHTMVCSSNATGRAYTLGPGGVFSGVPGECRNNSQCGDNKDEGPIPVGNYRMNRDDREGNEGFWRLEPDPQIPGWKCRLGMKRCGFMLHPGTVSLGCITADPTNSDTMRQYNRIDRLLQREDGANTLTVVP